MNNEVNNELERLAEEAISVGVPALIAGALEGAVSAIALVPGAGISAVYLNALATNRAFQEWMGIYDEPPPAGPHGGNFDRRPPERVTPDIPAAEPGSYTDRWAEYYDKKLSIEALGGKENWFEKHKKKMEKATDKKTSFNYDPTSPGWGWGGGSSDARDPSKNDPDLMAKDYGKYGYDSVLDGIHEYDFGIGDSKSLAGNLAEPSSPFEESSFAKSQLGGAVRDAELAFDGERVGGSFSGGLGGSFSEGIGDSFSGGLGGSFSRGPGDSPCHNDPDAV